MNEELVLFVLASIGLATLFHFSMVVLKPVFEYFGNHLFYTLMFVLMIGGVGLADYGFYGFNMAMCGAGITAACLGGVFVSVCLIQRVYDNW